MRPLVSLMLSIFFIHLYDFLTRAPRRITGNVPVILIFRGVKDVPVGFIQVCSPVRPLLLHEVIRRLVNAQHSRLPLAIRKVNGVIKLVQLKVSHHPA